MSENEPYNAFVKEEEEREKAVEYIEEHQ